MKVLIIIPAYNESESIASVVQSVVDEGYEYIVVNDGSVDDTLEICRSNNIHHLNLPCNLGIGGAVQAGHRFALENGYDIDVQIDGDGQHDVTYVRELLFEIEKGADVAIGSRFLEKTDGFQSSFMRRVGIRWLNFLIRLLSGVKVTDSTSGFRACGVKAIKLFCSDYSSDYPEPESIVSASRQGLSVHEVPVIMKERTGGVSSISAFSGIFYMIKVTLAMFVASMSTSKNRRKVS